MDKCPFKPGQYVVYAPSQRGYDLEDGVRLESGKRYRIERIEKGCYVVVDGYHHPGGGVYWTEFEKAQDE
ncbi:MAG: hypothetical protein WC869_14125 [Phycisphaerae bacterium]|jgi:hypothetical protein